MNTHTQIKLSLSWCKPGLIVAFLLILSQHTIAQFIDNYGVNIGLSYSNQLWNYKKFSVDNPNQDYKPGLAVFLSAEKKDKQSI